MTKDKDLLRTPEAAVSWLKQAQRTPVAPDASKPKEVEMKRSVIVGELSAMWNEINALSQAFGRNDRQSMRDSLALIKQAVFGIEFEMKAATGQVPVVVDDENGFPVVVDEG